MTTEIVTLQLRSWSQQRDYAARLVADLYDDDMVSKPIAIERWRERFPTVSHACVYLMTTHEATHLGQLSAWRRAGGRPAV